MNLILNNPSLRHKTTVALNLAQTLASFPQQPASLARIAHAVLIQGMRKYDVQLLDKTDRRTMHINRDSWSSRTELEYLRARLYASKYQQQRYTDIQPLKAALPRTKPWDCVYPVCIRFLECEGNQDYLSSSISARASLFPSQRTCILDKYFSIRINHFIFWSLNAIQP